jgi:hypothetical protein
LQKKDVNIEFIKSTDINIKTYNYEWTRAFNLFFIQLLIQLIEKCNEWQFLCSEYKETKHCCVPYYISHNVNTTISILLNPSFYPDRFEIGDYPAKSFP